MQQHLGFITFEKRGLFHGFASYKNVDMSGKHIGQSQGGTFSTEVALALYVNPN